MRDFSKAKRIVIKVGTNVLTGPGGVDISLIRVLAKQIAKLVQQGRQVILVTSGAIGTGLAAAAAIAIVVISPWQRGAVDPVVPGGEHQTVVQPDQPVINGDHLVYTTTELPHRGERRIDRDYIGVFDASRDSLLLLEVDRTRTVRIPVAGDL